MTSSVVLPPKNPAESILLKVDFLSKLSAGETITLANATTVSVFSGIDPSPSSIVSGSPTYSGSVLSQLVVNGVDGVIYLLTFSVNTSLGQTLQIQGLLVVLASDL